MIESPDVGAGIDLKTGARLLNGHAPSADFVLEESTNLIDWYPVTSPTATNFDTISAQPSGKGAGLYFRLIHK